MDRLLGQARALQVTRIIVIRKEIWNSKVVSKKPPSLVLTHDALLYQPSSPQMRSTTEPDELENAVYLGFTGWRRITFGYNPSGRDCVVLSEKGVRKTHFDIRLSEFGTWVVRNYDSNHIRVNNIPAGPQDDIALHPAEWKINRINVVNNFVGCIIVYDFPLTKRNLDEYLSVAATHTKVDTTALQETQSLSSSSSLTRSTTSSFASNFGSRDFFEDASSAYILLDFTGMSWSPTAYCAIRAYNGKQRSGLKAGARYLVHQFPADHLMRLKLYYYSTLQDHFPVHERLATVVDIDEDACLLVQQYHGRQHLTGLDPREACMAMTQMLHALDALHDKGISHGHIRPEFMIQSFQHGTFSLQLDGLWCSRLCVSSSEQLSNPGFDDDLRALARSLLFLLRSDYSLEREGELDCAHPTHTPLDLNDCPSIGDPILYSMLKASMEGKTTARTLLRRIHEMTGGEDGALVTTVAYEVTSKVNFATGRVGQDQRTMRAYKRVEVEALLKTVLIGAQHGATEADLELINKLSKSGRDYICRHDIVAMMNTVQRSSVASLLESKGKRSGVLQISVTCMPAYIAVLNVINASQVLAMMGLSWTGSMDANRMYDVRGIHSGIFVDITWFNETFAPAQDVPSLRTTSGLDTLSASKIRLLDRFPFEEYVFFTTSLRWCALIVMRRCDHQTLWEPLSSTPAEWYTIEQTLAKCEAFGLMELKQCIARCLDDDPLEIPSLSTPINQIGTAWFAGLEHTAELSAADTSDSDDDPLKFKRRKKPS